MQRINDWLFIGKYRDTLDGEYLRAHHIGAMLQLAERVKQPPIETLYLPVEDGEYLPHPFLMQGIEFIKTQHSAKHPLLIACGAGISRSATFCMVALHEIENLSLLEAFRQVKKQHPTAQPHPKLLESLCDYYGVKVQYEKLLVEVRGW